VYKDYSASKVAMKELAKERVGFKKLINVNRLFGDD